ncbi:hypothetical protein D3C72_1738630 [compost metagenome]
MSSTPTPRAASSYTLDAAPSQRLPTRRRWFMLSLLLVATIINYVDRVNISIAAPFMAKDLGLD